MHLLFLLISLPFCLSTNPRFDPTTTMRFVQIPADAVVNSVIYRLRASDEDFDYPLHFDLVGDGARGTVAVETLPCTKYNSVCQANVVLKKKLEVGRYYDFRIQVRDTKGGKDTIQCSISATNATTVKERIFPHIPGLIMIPEDAKRGTDLDYVVARKNPRFTKPVYLELWGSTAFAIRQRQISADDTEGYIFLLGPLDYETQATYHLTVYANDAWAEPGKDSRNIFGLELVVVVTDVQDTPPVFTMAPPITRLNNSLLPGDIVVRVHAEDGDKGSKRNITYGLVSEGNPFTMFFNISETDGKGEIILARPLEEITAISHVGDPILLTVIAEEVRRSPSEPEAMSTTVQLAFLLGDRGNQPPYFASDNYVARLEENSPQGTTVVFSDPYVPEVSDDDMGKNGVFSLTLENNNGTFEISPNVGERHTTFMIRVRDNSLLDYEETKTVRFKIIAQELGPATNLSTSVDVVVFLKDVNDNPPHFLQEEYFAEFPENATAGTRVTQVIANDPDTGVYGKVRYTQILGHLNTSLSLDPETGVITIATNNHGFDAEVMEEYRLYVEATDENGEGNRATVPLIIKLIDVNDEIPQFERRLYEFILSASLKNFTFPAYIKAIDKDASPPNNIVRYEIIHGNYENKFNLNSVTGELTLRQPLTRRNKRHVRFPRQTDEAEVYILTARAYDLGIPHLSSTCQINVYPPESRARVMLFIVPGKNPDRQKMEETLAAITGGNVIIQEVRPYSGNEEDATDVTSGDSGEKSVVVASVTYRKNSVVDVSQLPNKLGRNKTTVIATGTAEDKSAAYKGESNTVFWLLMILAILLIIALIILILCCICAGCPLYMPPKKRIIRVNSTDDDVHLVVKEKGIGKDNKSLQSVRKEAWSADMADSRTRPTHWQFNKRAGAVHIKEKEHVNGSVPDFRPKHYDETRSLNLTMHDGPNIIYNRDLQNRHFKSDRDIYLEDYDEYTTPKMRKRMQEEDMETESLRRHEMERGSDRVYRRDFGDNNSFRRSFRRQQQVIHDEDPEEQREQLFIREGNTEILRLITRGRQEDEKSLTHQQQQQRPVTLVQQPQYILVDSGKHLLMERFIEQQLLQQQELQQKHSNTPSVILPNETMHVKSEIQQNRSTKGSEISSSISESKRTAYFNTELLETSLRQQNELLRQILLEKERMDQKQEEMKLETQSLPGQSVMATQTDCTTGTQTDLQYLRPPKRQIRSDNDDSVSDDDDDFHLYIIKQSDDVNGIRWVKKRKKYKRRRAKDVDRVVAQVRRHIKTPILEENESPQEIDRNKKEERKNYNETKTSVLRRKKNEEQAKKEHHSESESRKTPLQKDILLEISESLDSSEKKIKISPRSPRKSPSRIEKTQKIEIELEYDSDSDDEKVYAVKAGKLAEFFSEDSLDFEVEDIKEEPTKKDRKNVVFSRQGSSTEQRESSGKERVRRMKSAEKLYSPREEEQQTINERRKYHSTSNLLTPEVERDRDSSSKENSIERDKTPKKMDKNKKIDVSKSTPRYMQWYNKKENKQVPKRKEEEIKKNPKKTSKVSKSLLADTKSSSIKKVYPTEKTTDKKSSEEAKKESVTSMTTEKSDHSEKSPDPTKFHPLLQHSEYRFEHPYSLQPNLAPVGVPAPQNNPPQPSITSPPHQISVTSPPHQISVQPTPSKKTPEKPPRPTLKKDPSIGKIGSDLNGKIPQDLTKFGQQPILKGIDEDYDSGIAMASLVNDVKKRNPMTEKKSIFTIAYDDMHTKQLRPDSTTPPF